MKQKNQLINKGLFLIVFLVCQVLLSACAEPDVVHFNPELERLKQERDAVRVSSFNQANLQEESTRAISVENRHEFAIHDTIIVESGASISGLNGFGLADGVEPLPLLSGTFLPAEEHEKNEKLMVSVEAMELSSFIHMIYGSYLKVNYMVDPSVEKRKDSVTVHMQEAVPYPAFKKLIKELLGKYNVTARKKEGIVFLESSKKKKVVDEEYLIFTGYSLPESVADEEQVLILVPFRYVDPNQFVGVFNSLHPLKSSSFRMTLPGNSLMIRDDAESVRKLLGLIAAIDKPYLSDQLVRLLSLDYIVPEDLVKRLEELLPSFGVPVLSESSKAGIRLLAMPEISALFLLSSSEEWLETALRLSDQLDGPMALGPEPRIFIYRPHNRKASVLAEIINGLRSGGNADGGRVQKEQGYEDLSQDKKAQLPEPPKTYKTGGTALKEGKLVITVDEGRNALVIYTTPVVYQELERVLQDLDTITRQVLVEITIAEVTLTDSLQYGVEWFFKNSGNKGSGFISTLGNLGIGGSGVFSLFTSTGGDFTAILNAFAEDDLVNILANPRLVVLDNESASFSVGTDVPVVTSEATSEDLPSDPNAPSVLRNIEYRKTGISVTVTPTIYSNGTLRLEIDQNLSEAQKNDVSPDTGSPLVLDRSSSTTVILKSGEAILLAGLISETKSSGNQRIPLLGDIPWIGNLFKTSSEQVTKTELMMQVRPVILDSPADMRIQTLEYEKITKDLLRLNKFFDK
ncbi:hypothetical protein JYT85_02105 [Desulfocapsa sp. AH-315-G09]|nr:hypothetical protein [Desulfocapsa sp.]MBN4065421.1 hypothetical protein [Desulfocapsa sp. AH-315-G09]